MPIEQDLLPSEEFHRAVMEAAQEFYNKTGVRATRVQMDWAVSNDGSATPISIDVGMES